MADDDLDYTDKYNTPLPPQQEQQFKQWTTQQSAATGRNVGNDLYDYDLRGWYAQNNGADLSGGHLTDEFKKPNHPTFSTGSKYHGIDGNEGGQWATRQDGSYSFAPGKTNLQNFSPTDMQDYFKKVEPNNVLLPQGLGKSEDAGEAARQEMMQRQGYSAAAPPALRMFASTLTGDRSKITEQHFSPEELDILRETSEKALAKGKNYFGYGDYGKGKEYEKNFLEDGSQAMMGALSDKRSSLAFTLGMARVKREDDGTIVINDKYHWAAKKEEVDKHRNIMGAASLLMRGMQEHGLLGVGNVIGNFIAPSDDGRDVEIRIPPKRR
jgi:hypothetical protein